MVCDFKVVKTLVGEFIEHFDHSMCMNTQDPQFASFKDLIGSSGRG
jgi:6-pyruvoyltetrahydropterin/6-carboxytetrahydropterin synthase